MALHVQQRTICCDLKNNLPISFGMFECCNRLDPSGYMALENFSARLRIIAQGLATTGNFLANDSLGEVKCNCAPA